MRKVCEVYLVSSSASDERGVELTFPVSRYEMMDAFEQIHTKSPGDVYWQVDEFYCFDYLAPHLDESTRKQRCRSTPMIGRRPIAAAGIFMICTACIRTQTPPPLHSTASRKRRVSLFSPPAPSLATALHADSIRSRAHTLKSHIRLAAMQTIMSVISATTSSTLALTPIRVTALVVTVPVPARTAAAIHGFFRMSRLPPVPATATVRTPALAVRQNPKQSILVVTAIAMARGSSIRPVSIGAQVPAETAARRTMIMPATA